MINLVQPFDPFGLQVELPDVDAIDDVAAGSLRHCIAENGFVVVSDFPSDDGLFVRLLKRLGQLTFTQGETSVQGYPDLNLVSNVGRTKPPRSVFHSDTSYVCQPPSFTALRAVAVPPTSGATLITNQYAAFDALPNDVRQRLFGVNVRHVVSGLDAQQLDETECWHPLFRRHPLTGRTALFLSTPKRCIELSGFTPNVGKRVIGLLYRHSQRKEFRYQHSWRSGDVLIWDNRCTLHRGQHEGVRGDRVFHRGLLCGEASVPAASPERNALPMPSSVSQTNATITERDHIA